MEEQLQQIRKYQKIIAINQSKIDLLKKDIEDLNIIKLKIEKLEQRVEDTATQTQSGISMIPQMFNGVMKMGVLSKIFQCAKGVQYCNALSELSAGEKKIQQSTEECYRKISELKREVSDYMEQIHMMQANLEDAE